MAYTSKILLPFISNVFSDSAEHNASGAICWANCHQKNERFHKKYDEKQLFNKMI